MLYGKGGDPLCIPVLTSLVPCLLGMLIVSFFKCMTALFGPTYRRGEGIKWNLVSYTVVMFSLATVRTHRNGLRHSNMCLSSAIQG